MKQSRTRVRGKGVSQETVAVKQRLSGGSRVEIGFTVPDPYGPGPVEPQVQQFNIEGILVAIPSPPRVQRATSGWLYYVVDSAWMNSVKAIISAAITPQLLLVTKGEGISVYKSVDQKSITDTIGSGFRQVQGKEGVVNPCSGFTRKGDFPTFSSGSANFKVTQVFQGSVSNGYSSCFVDYQFTIPVTGGVTPTAFTWLESQVVSAIPLTTSAASLHASAVADLQSGDMDLLTSLAEMNKTVAYIVMRLKDIARIIAAVKRKDFSFLTKFRKDYTPSLDPYLEARYAIRPLIIDVENSIRAFGSSGSLATLKRAARAEDISSSSSVSGTFSDANFTYTFKGNVTVTGRKRGGAIGKLSANLPSLYTLGMFNLATTAVELIPWSFVFQWFFNISGLIAELNPNPVYELQTGYLSVKADATITGTLSCKAADGTVCKGYIMYSYGSYNRTEQKQATLFAVDVNLDVPKLADLVGFLTKRL